MKSTKRVRVPLASDSTTMWSPELKRLRLQSLPDTPMSQDDSIPLSAFLPNTPVSLRNTIPRSFSSIPLRNDSWLGSLPSLPSPSPPRVAPMSVGEGVQTSANSSLRFRSPVSLPNPPMQQWNPSSQTQGLMQAPVSVSAPANPPPEPSSYFPRRRGGRYDNNLSLPFMVDKWLGDYFAAQGYNFQAQLSKIEPPPASEISESFLEQIVGGAPLRLVSEDTGSGTALLETVANWNGHHAHVAVKVYWALGVAHTKSSKASRAKQTSRSFLQRDDNSLEIERAIMRQHLNPLLFGRATPHVVPYYGEFSRVYADPNSGAALELSALVMGFVNGGIILAKMPTLVDNWILEIPDFIEVVVPVIYTLLCFSDIGLMHNDLHPGNVIISKLPRPVTLQYIVDHDESSDTYLMVTLRTDAHVQIIDFDRASKPATFGNGDPVGLTNTLLDRNLCADYGQCNEFRPQVDLVWFLYIFAALLYKTWHEMGQPDGVEKHPLFALVRDPYHFLLTLQTPPDGKARREGIPCDEEDPCRVISPRSLGVPDELTCLKNLTEHAMIHSSRRLDMSALDSEYISADDARGRCGDQWFFVRPRLNAQLLGECLPDNSFAE